MNNKPLLAALVLAVGISACNDSTLPTEAGRDLLKNPAGAPVLSGSTYGQALAEFLAETGAVAVRDTTGSFPPIDPLPTGGGNVQEHESDPSSGNVTKWKPSGWVHIADTSNATKYKPPGYEHVGSGSAKSKYKPVGWVHITDRTKGTPSNYVPPNYEHISSGEFATKYRKATVVAPPDTIQPGGPGTPIGE